jgi:lysylphosphatidylglycerol synthetase-like protein (DUF2156 family)
LLAKLQQRPIRRAFQQYIALHVSLIGPMISSGLLQTRKRNVVVASCAALCIVATLLVCAFRTDITSSLAVFPGLHFSYNTVDEWPGMCKNGHGQVRIFVANGCNYLVAAAPPFDAANDADAGRRQHRDGSVRGQKPPALGDSVSSFFWR